jgi:hypothetical protein
LSPSTSLREPAPGATDPRPQEYSKVRWKIDLIMMPVLMIIYGLQFADK